MYQMIKMIKIQKSLMYKCIRKKNIIYIFKYKYIGNSNIIKVLTKFTSKIIKNHLFSSKVITFIKNGTKK